MPPTLYHVPKTISSPIVQILLELDLLPDVVKIETLTFPELKQANHRARNPMGTSPAFTDDKLGISIWESGAVLSYLLQVYDTEYTMHPPPSAPQRDRALFLHLQQFVIATVYPFLASLYIHTFKPIEEQDEEYIASAKDKWRTVLAPTLVMFFGTNDYFVGNKLSAIDFLMCKPFGNANSMGLLKEFPTLMAHYEKIQQRSTHALAYEFHEKPWKM